MLWRLHAALQQRHHYQQEQQQQQQWSAAEMVVFPTEQRSEVGARSRCPARLQDAVLTETLCSAPHVTVGREEFRAVSSARHCGCPALVC